MGRAGETVRRTFAMAGKMKAELGADGDGGHDNERVLRYMAKLTINPAIAHGLAHEVGSIEVGQARRHRAVAAGVLRRQAAARPEVRLPRLRRHRRPERGHRHLRTAGARPAVRRVRRHARRPLGRLRRAGRPPTRAATRCRPAAAGSPCAAPAASARPTCASTPGSAPSMWTAHGPGHPRRRPAALRARRLGLPQPPATS